MASGSRGTENIPKAQLTEPHKLPMFGDWKDEEEVSYNSSSSFIDRAKKSQTTIAWTDDDDDVGFSRKGSKSKLPGGAASLSSTIPTEPHKLPMFSDWKDDNDDDDDYYDDAADYYDDAGDADDNDADAGDADADDADDDVGFSREGSKSKLPGGAASLSSVIQLDQDAHAGPSWEHSESKRDDGEGLSLERPVSQISSDTLQTASWQPGPNPTFRLPTTRWPSVPNFGDWNKNPAQADGYTVVFDQLHNDGRSLPYPTSARPYLPQEHEKQPSKYLSTKKSDSQWFSSRRAVPHRALPTPMKQTKQSEGPNSGSTGASEPMPSRIKNHREASESMTIPYKPHISRDAIPSQATNLATIEATTREANEPETADDPHQHQRGRPSRNSYAPAVNSAGGVPTEQSSLHPAPNCAQSGAGNNVYKPMEKLKERVYDVVYSKKNLGMLQTKSQVLAEEIAQVRTLLMSGENDTEDKVQQWLSEADEILKDTKDFLEGTHNIAGKNRLCGTCWDPRSSWETGEMSRDVDKILERRKALDLSSYFYGLSYYCKKLESRENKLQAMLEALMGIHNMIGIYGMIGIGKSVLAEELARRARNKQLFDAIVMVQVSDSVDVCRLIQTQIANKIGLQLSDGDDEGKRYSILYNKLNEKLMAKEQENSTRSTQQSKILLILDGIRHVIDLTKIGIPYMREGTSRCKVVLVSRSANVCTEMGAKKIFTVECLDLDEAKILFQESLEDKIQTMEITPEKYQFMESVILMKCGGLPSMINSLACELRSMSWADWEIIADHLVRNSLLEVDEVKEVASPILELYNNFIGRGGKEKLFLLCCLIHEQGVDVPLDKLMRYAIGFGIFEVDSLTSIVDQINSWVHELKSLSLLLEAKPHHVKMHDIIQDVGISALSQGNYNLPVLLDAGTGWHTRESYENCVAISMKPESNYKCLNGLEWDKLQAFLFKDKQYLNLADNIFQRMRCLEKLDMPDEFFQGMQNLKILEISDTKAKKLPSSIGVLKNLVTLHLENCDIQGEIISTVCKLHKLEVLSLRGSHIVVLPEEIGNLANLRVLDLTGCMALRTFCLDAVVKMDRLRELYMYDGYAGWQVGDVQKLWSLPLEVLELRMYPFQAPTSSDHKLIIRRFRICIEGKLYGPLEDSRCFSSVLLIRGGHYKAPFGELGLRDLMPCVEFLKIEGVTLDLPNSIGDLYADVFLHLKRIHIVSSEMKYILDTTRDIFPELEVLVLKNLSNLERICRWHPSQNFFPQLRELRLNYLRKLYPYVLPVELVAKLRVMEVSGCTSLVHIFPPDRTGLIRELPYMERLELVGLTSLRTLQHQVRDSVLRDEHWRPSRLLFSGKIKFPSLEMMTLKNLSEVENVWDFSGSAECAAELQSQPYGKTACFGNLKSITVSECFRLKRLFPSTIINSLLQLETLQVDNCVELEEIVNDPEDEASTTATITFPKLKLLRLECLTTLRCFYRGRHFLKFPILKELHLTGLRKMKAFIPPTTRSIETILFDGEIDFTSLENLEVSWMDIELLQRHSETTVFKHLSRLTLKRLKNLKALPSAMSKTLRGLELEDIAFTKKIFSVQREHVSSCMSLLISRELEELILSDLESLEELIDDENPVDELFLSLRKLELRCLGQLKRVQWNLLNSLTSLSIEGLRGWTSVISTTLLVGGGVLPLLENIRIEDCKNLKAVISQEEVQDEGQDFAKYGITIFPCLRKIELRLLLNLESFSKGSYEAHFPSLETIEISSSRSLQEFSLGPLRTPRLKSLKVDSETMEADALYDLNSAIKDAMWRAAAKRYPSRPKRLYRHYKKNANGRQKN